MSERCRRRGALALMVSFPLLACQETRWEPWAFVRIERQPMQASVSFASTPAGADVYVDGTHVGTTPFQSAAEYTETAAIFERNLVQIEGMEHRILNTETERREVTVNPAAHTARFTRPYYVESVVPFVVPTDQLIRAKLETREYPWEVVRVDEETPRQQSIEIRSDPPGAAVFIDGEHVGNTPIQYTADFAQSEVILQKRIVEERGGRAPYVGLEEKRQRTGTTPSLHHVAVRQVGFLDENATLKVPRDESTLHFPLAPAQGLSDPETHLKIVGRKEYLSVLEDLIAQHAVPDPSAIKKNPADEPRQLEPELDVYEQTFQLRVKDVKDLARMVDLLRNLASDQELVLRLTSANFTATFDTNVVVATIEHTIKGHARPNARVLVVRPGRPPDPNNAIVVGNDGQYEFTAHVERGQTYFFIVSVFQPETNRDAGPIVVFAEIDVHSQESRELDRDVFFERSAIESHSLDELVEEMVSD